MVSSIARREAALLVAKRWSAALLVVKRWSAALLLAKRLPVLAEWTAALQRMGIWQSRE
jgi:hypothetical protein